VIRGTVAVGLVPGGEFEHDGILRTPALPEDSRSVQKFHADAMCGGRVGEGRKRPMAASSKNEGQQRSNIADWIRGQLSVEMMHAWTALRHASRKARQMAVIARPSIIP